MSYAEELAQYAKDATAQPSAAPASYSDELQSYANEPVKPITPEAKAEQNTKIGDLNYAFWIIW